MIATRSGAGFERAQSGSRTGKTVPLEWKVLLALLIVLAAHAASATVGVTLATSNLSPSAGGAAFGYTITLTNNDLAAPAVDVVVTLPMPAGIVFQNVSLAENSPPPNPPAGTRGYFSCSTPAVAQNGLVTCSATSFPASTVAVTTTATITVVAQVVADVASGVRTATARVVAGGVQFTASVLQNIQVNAPLSISKSATPTASRGANLVYTITVNNSGGATALNATISDTLPTTTSFVSVTGTGPFHDGCNFNPVANALQCTAVDVPGGLSRITLVVKTSPATPVGSLTNTAIISNAGTGTIAVGSANASTNITP